MPSHAKAFAPGRVNLIGEHTDYNDGLALPFAIAAGVTVSAERSTGMFEVQLTDGGESDRFDADAIVAAPGWRAYPRGIVAELQLAGVELPAARLRISSTLPQRSGLASSAALTVALCLSLCALADVAQEPTDTARLCATVER
ncbi:MAG: hypothetical protein JOZ64_07750, partial [Solirubrobacterales bacterium]|nr:hypothetical protein [Solirubrobacterales bacterium]